MTVFARDAGDEPRDLLQTAAWAALLSGLPSTLHALVTKRDPLEATVAAGSVLLPREDRLGRVLVAAIPVHLGLSVTWTLVLASVLPRRNPVAEGTVAGLAIAALDLGVIGRRFPRIGDLETLPQIADHVAFGLIVATRLPRHRRKA